uniref:YqgF/RNase H-like domain-containing protein n=1 Tax=Trieres chinensis TaxID=1514140 RepID=A0A7S1ZP92_TRICV|mmetsp:Transcript_30375/g.61922  ORF Transcript_30375/g.61922 Transcript_30375/m.61922 type:complete len:243 (+) Transcript_30375:165-893(+)
MSAATKLGKCFVSPSRVASILDWKAMDSAVMAVDFSGKHVGVAVAGHPARGSVSCLLTSSEKKSQPSDELFGQLEDLVKEHKVCALVVGWPLQAEGRPGKPCGRVLHVLDRIVQRKGSMLSKARPFTLWDDRSEVTDNDRNDDDVPDEWGRSVSFSCTPSVKHDDQILISKVRYARSDSLTDSSNRATDILSKFLDSHWECSDLGQIGHRDSTSMPSVASRETKDIISSEGRSRASMEKMLL